MQAIQYMEICAADILAEIPMSNNTDNPIYKLLSADTVMKLTVMCILSSIKYLSCCETYSSDQCDPGNDPNISTYIP